MTDCDLMTLSHTDILMAFNVLVSTFVDLDFNLMILFPCVFLSLLSLIVTPCISSTSVRTLVCLLSLVRLSCAVYLTCAPSCPLSEFLFSVHSFHLDFIAEQHSEVPIRSLPASLPLCLLLLGPLHYHIATLKNRKAKL